MELKEGKMNREEELKIKLTLEVLLHCWKAT
jgi:hypothetical protein